MSSLISPINTAAIDAISDENIRLALRSIADMLVVRNGHIGSGEDAFVTRKDIADLTGLPVATAAIGNWPVLQGGSSSQGTGSISDIESAIINSPAFQDLGTQVSQANTNIVAEQNARIAAVQQVANDLLAEASTRGTADNNLATRVGTAESNITSLQSTTSTTTTNLSALTTRVGTAESNISNLTTTTGNQATAISSLTTTVGTKVSTFYQSATPTANAIGDIWFDTGNNSRAKRWNGTAWVDTSDTRIAAVQAAITSEATTRADQDNAITSSMNSQFSTVNSNISALQTTTTTLTNNYSSLSSSVSTLSTTVSGHTTSIENEVTARQTADGQINAKYSVKIDSNGYVSGYGLISEANNAAPASSFIVRADKFAIGSPSGPGITPRVPFSVLTTADAAGNAPGVYIDEALIKKAAITNALIGNVIQSNNFNAGAGIGWKIDKEGNLIATHLNAATGTFAGTLTASAVNAVNTINLAGDVLIVPRRGAFSRVASQADPDGSDQLAYTLSPVEFFAGGRAVIFIRWSSYIGYGEGGWGGFYITCNGTKIWDTGRLYSYGGDGGDVSNPAVGQYRIPMFTFEHTPPVGICTYRVYAYRQAYGQTSAEIETTLISIKK